MLTSFQPYARIYLRVMDFSMIEMCLNASTGFYIFLNHGKDGRITKSKIYYFLYIVLGLIPILQGQYGLYSIQLGSTTSFLVAVN